MKASSILLSALLLWSALACAQNPAITMDGVPLPQKRGTNAPNGNQLLELIATN